MEEVHQRCREQLKETQAHMNKYFDTKRLPSPLFKPGNQILHDGHNLKTKRSLKKLDHKMHGSFKIIKRIGTHAVRLQLPKTMRCHNVFHVSLLESY